jgi:hypothetical protein
MFVRKSGVVVLLGTLLLCFVSFAQIRSATITGTVKDSTGAVILDVDVVVTHQETGIATTIKTTASGIYTAPYLAVGTYIVAVDVVGFAPYKQTGVALAVNQTVRVDVDLKVGAIEQTVEVSAASTQIQTDSSTVQGAVASQAISALPNPTANPLYYALLQAGVAPRVASGDTTSLNSFGVGGVGRRQWSTLGVNGGRLTPTTFNWTVFR